jgi:arylsulfatase A-like enzyme
MNKPNILVLWGDDIGLWNISYNNRGLDFGGAFAARAASPKMRRANGGRRLLAGIRELWDTASLEAAA